MWTGKSARPTLVPSDPLTLFMPNEVVGWPLLADV